jgi:hypothetical protein
MRNSPSSGFACSRRFAAIARRSTLWAGWRGPNGAVGQARPAHFVPVLQHLVDRLPGGVQVSGDRLGAPPVQVQRHDRPPPHDGIRCLVVPGEPPRRPDRQRFAGQDGPDGVLADGAVEAVSADRRDLPQPKRRVLGLDLNDGAPDVWREHPTGSRRRCQGLEDEEAAHAVGVEAGDLAAQGTLGHGGFAGAGRDRLAEEHDRAEQFVGFLSGRGDQESQLVPVVGGAAARSRAGWHRPSPDGTRSPRWAGPQRGDGCFLTARAPSCQRHARSGHGDCPPASTTS